MAIHILPEPDITISRSDFERYRYDYSKAFQYYVGPIPTLEEYIRSRQNARKAMELIDGHVGMNQNDGKILLNECDKDAPQN